MVKISYITLLLVMVSCLACAAVQPKPQDFAGSWVVDMAASEQLNPTLANREHMREFMAQLTMIIDMDKHELIMLHVQEKEYAIPFKVLEQSPGKLAIRTDEGSGESTDINLELKNGVLTFKVADDESGRDSFVFVPAAN